MTTTTDASIGGFEIDATTARRWLDDASARTVLIDVREPDEHARERIDGAQSLPLSRLQAGALAGIDCDRIVLHCLGGTRSAEALRLLRAAIPTGTPVYLLAGGLRAWKTAGLPTLVGGGPRLSVMRQVQLVVGGVVLGGSLLGYFMHPGFALLAGAMGLGLTIAGATGTCVLASLLGMLPFNRIPAFSNTNPARSAECACLGGACVLTEGDQ